MNIFSLILLILFLYTAVLEYNFVFFFFFQTNLQPENRQPMAPEVFNRFADDTKTRVQVKQISLPDLSVPLQLGRREPFSLFIPKHRKLAARLIDIFLGSSPVILFIYNILPYLRTLIV